jgi:N utilization substance protein B
MRTQAREAVLKLLFSKLFDNDADLIFKKSIYNEFKLNEEDINFAETLYNNSFNNFDLYNEEISLLSSGYSSARIFKVDKCAMVMAIAEMNLSDVPKIVIIDEAVKLVKKYSTENSVNFVNGILAAYKNKQEVKNIEQNN